MNYINQAPKEFNAQSAAFRKRHGNVNTLNYAGSPWVTQPKYDGVHIMVHTEGEGYARTRTGEEVLSVPHIIEQAKEKAGPGQVLFCEAYLFGEHHKTINGMLRRKTPQPKLLAMVYDVVPQECFDEGYDPTPYRERFRKLQPFYSPSILTVPSMRILPDGMTVQEYALALTKLPDAYDGAILRDVTAPWRRGAAKEGEVIKVKPSLSLDLLVTGHKVEHKPTKLGGYITVTYNGVESNVGSGLTQDILQALTQGVKATGRIAEVECMGITPSGKLREPRFKSFRYDTEQEEMKG